MFADVWALSYDAVFHGCFLLALAAVIYWGLPIRYIPNNRVGIVEKLLSLNGSVPSGIIARNNEAGYQPWVLRGGWHLMKPFIYRVHRVPLVTIPQGSIGYVFARDGAPLRPDQALASNETAYRFDDVEDFLDNGGQKGPQRTILREGTHAINLAQFVVISRDTIYALNLETAIAYVFGGLCSVAAGWPLQAGPPTSARNSRCATWPRWQPCTRLASSPTRACRSTQRRHRPRGMLPAASCWRPDCLSTASSRPAT